MPDYRQLSSETAHERITDGLLRLRDQLDREVPPRTLDSTLRLATWNIRDFDSPSYGTRLPDAYYFLAEVISRFDLVAIQEVNRDLTALETLMAHLGSHWRYLVTDTTEGRPGNNERLAFVYDTRTVRFTGLAGELVLPEKLSHSTPTRAGQVARTPFTAGFQAGWVELQLATVHILYGEDKADSVERVDEIHQIAQFLADRSDDPASASPNLVLLGDFNIYDRTGKTMDALTSAGWVIPEELQKLPGTNVPHDKFYDQIAVRPVAHRFQPTGPAGVVDYYDSVFRQADRDLYAAAMGAPFSMSSTGVPRSEHAKSTYYASYWRTHQMSDHLPMWIDLRVDYSQDHLLGIGTEPRPPRQHPRPDPLDAPSA